MNKNNYIYILMFTSLILYLFLIFYPNIEFIMHRLIADDAFYYYKIVENFSNGNGFVFNLGIPTNGFHPLLFFILYFIFGIFGKSLLFIKSSLFVLAVFHIASSYILFLFVRRISSEYNALLASFLWLFNPFIVLKVMFGLEVIIQAFFIIILLYYLSFIDLDQRLNIFQIFLIGSIFGLMILSRMDSFLYIGCFSLYVLFIRYKKSIFYILDLIKIVIISMIYCLPWMIYNYVTMGFLLPNSGYAMNVINTLYNHGYFNTLAKSLYDYFASLVFFVVPLGPVNRYIAILLFLFVLFVTIYYNWNNIYNVLNKHLLITIFISVFLIFYIFYQGGIRSWYWITLSILLLILISKFYVKIRNDNLFYYYIIIFIVMISYCYGFVYYLSIHNNPSELIKYDVALYLDRNFYNDCPECRVGSFNTGVYNYFNDKYDILNLDGVVNPDAYYAHKDGYISKYISDNVDYIVDAEEFVSHLDLNLSVVHSFSWACNYSACTTYIYKIIR